MMDSEVSCTGPLELPLPSHLSLLHHTSSPSSLLRLLPPLALCFLLFYLLSSGLLASAFINLTLSSYSRVSPDNLARVYLLRALLEYSSYPTRTPSSRDSHTTKTDDLISKSAGDDLAVSVDFPAGVNNVEMDDVGEQSEMLDSSAGAETGLWVNDTGLEQDTEIVDNESSHNEDEEEELEDSYVPISWREDDTVPQPDTPPFAGFCKVVLAVERASQPESSSTTPPYELLGDTQDYGHPHVLEAE
ncbi:hypothetical protein BO83DRAFT_391678 [Aspergillus eucalypticola CBS 122712]|uniref:Uncharacterized protein n=1 Tax=Aspergillus eucalypticola (strain CBS 122712 / IBT 29274) TaxID=1448314 RepID=A0A317UZB0_ASPEC|nr:uncharacterized protein BO83DRAFT_391678 [Aspergillus eucalypticola CBS 122712]PWY66689.1 hypothetical protein BO83DRAFT_391678 [Aspergillus eucalypticola CBS 122712]